MRDRTWRIGVGIGLVSLALGSGFAAVAAETPASIKLDAYQLAAGPIQLTGVEDNLSGITFCQDSGTLFAVLNAPTLLIELDLQGAVKRQISLLGFDDTEDVCWLGAKRFAVVEERRRMLVVFDLSDSNTVDYADCKRYLIDAAEAGNSGLEGVAFDVKARMLYVVKEKSPRRLYALPLPAGDAEPAPSTPWDIQANNQGMKDLAAVTFVSANSNLVFCSDESKVLVECNAEGKTISRLSLAEGNGLTGPLKQPEGVTMDDKGVLYVTSEPNVLYIWKKP